MNIKVKKNINLIGFVITLAFHASNAADFTECCQENTEDLSQKGHILTSFVQWYSQNRHSQGIGTVLVEMKVENLNKKGNAASAIYQVTGKTQESSFVYIMKCFENEGVYVKESRNLSKVQTQINRLGEGAGAARNNLPLFVNYMGSLMIEAPGSLKMIILTKADEIGLNEYLKTYVLEDKLDENFLNTHIKSAGKQIGAFHHQFGQLSAHGEQFQTALHNDLHMENIYCNPKDSRITFMDNERLNIDVKEDCKIDLDRLFIFSVEKSMPYNFFFNHYNIEKHPILDFTTNPQGFKLHQFLNALKEGYLSAFEDPYTKKLLTTIIDDGMKELRNRKETIIYL